jgi:methyl-accepting chemotaxis protein
LAQGFFMRRTRLVLLLTPVWLGFCGLGMAAILMFAPGPELYAALALCTLIPAVAGWAIANATDKAERAALSALGEATGIGAMGKAGALAHTREIVANLCARLERARLYQSAFEQISMPAMIAEQDGTIVKMSAGIATRAPECAQMETVAALLGSDVARLVTPMASEVRFAGHDWQAMSVPLGGDRWLIGLERPGVVVTGGDWHAMTEALAGGATGFRFGPAALAGNPDLEAVNLGFAALDDSVGALAALARDGETAELAPANGGLAPQIRALAETIAQLAAARDAEAEANRSARARLEKIGVLVELCRKNADELTAAAEAARLASDGAREAIDAGCSGAVVLAETQTGISGLAGDASDAAKRANENVAAVETLTREIDELVAGIEDVSFRTNLLALNAAVEAARAGEKGAGFAVVAAEVRELAQASSKNSKAIRGLVTKSLAQAGAGSAQALTLIATLADIDAHLLNLSDETSRMETTLKDGGAALGKAQAEIGILAQRAQAQTEALWGDRGDNQQPDGGLARRV